MHKNDNQSNTGEDKEGQGPLYHQMAQDSGMRRGNVLGHRIPMSASAKKKVDARRSEILRRTF